MQFTITRRRYSSLPQITVEIDAEFERASNAVRLGAAVKVLVRQARERGERADLTRANLTRAVLTDAVLTRANLTRADLTDADLTRADLTRAVLTDADLTRADLTDADLTRADLTRADLTDADLTRAVLTDAEVPVIPKIDSAILAAITDGKGELEMSEWHSCETTHCRAGWAITLAGDKGRALEHKYGPAAAGALIYAASRPGERVPNFYASDEAALADIKACAARQEAA